MVLVDLPGYGYASTGAARQKHWAKATRKYLRTRTQLACAFVLIDATLGITADDERFLDVLDSLRVPYHGVLTKADLLAPLELAQSYKLVSQRVTEREHYAGGDLPICSARNAAGVAELWERLKLGVLHLPPYQAEGCRYVGEDGSSSEFLRDAVRVSGE